MTSSLPDPTDSPLVCKPSRLDSADLHILSDFFITPNLIHCDSPDDHARYSLADVLPPPHNACVWTFYRFTGLLLWYCYALNACTPTPTPS